MENGRPEQKTAFPSQRQLVAQISEFRAQSDDKASHPNPYGYNLKDLKRIMHSLHKDPCWYQFLDSQIAITRNNAARAKAGIEWSAYTAAAVFAIIPGFSLGIETILSAQDTDNETSQQIRWKNILSATQLIVGALIIAIKYVCAPLQKEAEEAEKRLLALQKWGCDNWQRPKTKIQGHTTKDQNPEALVEYIEDNSGLSMLGISRPEAARMLTEIKDEKQHKNVMNKIMHELINSLTQPESQDFTPLSASPIDVLRHLEPHLKHKIQREIKAIQDLEVPDVKTSSPAVESSAPARDEQRGSKKNRDELIGALINDSDLYRAYVNTFIHPDVCLGPTSMYSLAEIQKKGLTIWKATDEDLLVKIQPTVPSPADSKNEPLNILFRPTENRYTMLSKLTSIPKQNWSQLFTPTREREVPEGQRSTPHLSHSLGPD